MPWRITASKEEAPKKTKRPPYIPHQEWVLHRTYANSASGCFFLLSSGEELKHHQSTVRMRQSICYNVFNYLALGEVNKRDSQIARYCRQGCRTTELKCVVNKWATWAELVILSEGAGKQGHRRQCIIRTMACALEVLTVTVTISVLEDVTMEPHALQKQTGYVLTQHQAHHSYAKHNR